MSHPTAFSSYDRWRMGLDHPSMTGAGERAICENCDRECGEHIELDVCECGRPLERHNEVIALAECPAYEKARTIDFACPDLSGTAFECSEEWSDDGPNDD